MDPKRVKERAEKCWGIPESLVPIPRFIWRRMYILVLLIAVVIFTLLGGAIFYMLEQPNEYRNHQYELNEQEEKILDLVTKLQNACDNNMKCKENIEIEISKHMDGWNKTIDDKNRYNWQHYCSAVWYSITIYTTIGYGNIAPATNAGKIFTIIYALIGIPLMLSFLNELGKKLSYVCDAMCTKLQHLQGKNTKKTCRLPVAMAIAIIFIYIFVCSTIVWLTESGPLNNYLDAVYFTFTSLTTIGLGDVMPEEPCHILTTVWLLFTGLALVSALISMLNARIEDKYFAAIEAMKEKLQDDHGKNALGTVVYLTRCHFSFDECENEDEKEEPCNPFPPAVLGMSQVRPEFRKHTPHATTIDD